LGFLGGYRFARQRKNRRASRLIKVPLSEVDDTSDACQPHPVYGVMAGKVAANLFVSGVFVHHQLSFAAEIGAQDRGDIGNPVAVNVEAAGIP
jgi:hypothetical protein